MAEILHVERLRGKVLRALLATINDPTNDPRLRDELEARRQDLVNAQQGKEH